MQNHTYSIRATLSAMRQPTINHQLFRRYLERVRPYISRRAKWSGNANLMRARLYAQLIRRYLLD